MNRPVRAGPGPARDACLRDDRTRFLPIETRDDLALAAIARAAGLSV